MHAVWADDVGELLPLLLEALPLGVTVIAPDLTLRYINARHARANGLPIEAQLGKSLRAYLPQAADIIEPKLQFVFDNGIPLLRQEIHATQPNADGRYIHRLASYYPVRDATGAIKSVLALIQDSSDDGFAEQLLKEHEHRLLNVLDNLYAFVGVLELDGTLTEANRAPLVAAGITLESVRGKKFWDCHWWLHSEAVRVQLKDAVARCRQGEVVRYDVQVRMQHDELMWIDFMLAPLRDSDGNITQLIPSGMDISQRHATEAALYASEDRYRSVIESSDDAIITKSLAGVITGWNAAAERLLGYGADEAVGQHVTILFPPTKLAEEAELMARIVRGERVPPFETTRIHRDGSLVEVSVTISPLRDRSGKVIGACKLARDISLQKHQRALLERALDEKTALLHEVHHRVKNNLQIVSSLLNLQARKVSPDIAAVLAESQGRIKAMALVHQLLYESGSMAWIDVSDFLARLVSLVGAIHGVSGSGIDLTFTRAAQPARLSMQRLIPCGLVINELLLNAIKHAFPAGQGGQISVEVTVPSANHLEIVVSDDGMGLPAHFCWTDQRGLGSQLIPMFIHQLHAELVTVPTTKGARFRLALNPDRPEEVEETDVRRTHSDC